MMSKPVAVLISDVHYSIKTLDLADKSMRLAIAKATELRVPLIVAGDTHDTKALLRGECVKRIIDTFKSCEVPSYVLVGNHDRINEKDPAHSLEFLRPYTNIVQHPVWHSGIESYLVPYFSENEELKKWLVYTAINYPHCTRLIMHQGLIGSDQGHYIQDKSALLKEDVADFRVISGHYHRRQDIKCGRPRKGAIGLFSYIGSPYTLSFGEAKDPEKGFQILMDDGTLEFVPTNLRKHVLLEYNSIDLIHSLYAVKGMELTSPQDLLWIKVIGPSSELGMLKKKEVAEWLGRDDFKLDLIPTKDETREHIDVRKLNQADAMDAIVDTVNDSEEYKKELKALWRELINADINS